MHYSIFRPPIIHCTAVWLLPASPPLAVYRSSMDECFQHSLQQLDPSYAAALAARSRRSRPLLADKMLTHLGLDEEEGEDLTKVSDKD